MIARTIYIFYYLSFVPLIGFSQFSFEYETTLPVTKKGEKLDLAWAGGINSGQYQKIDLNNDGIEDLVVFDRTSGKLNTFINSQDAFEYIPEYEYLLPEDVNNWTVFADYNCDGKKDIFTNTLLGIKVYKNISSDQLAWELVADPIFTQGFTSQINLQVNESDIPAINDVDGDGDLDILVFNFFTGGTIEYHQNRSMDNYNNCDKLEFVRITKNWGKFEECNCGDYAFGETCAEKNANRANNRAARTMHAGGKAILAFNNDGDGDKDLLFGDEECTDLVYFENKGTSQEAIIQDFNNQYPNVTNPASFPFFPAAFYEDVDFDGIKDLIVSSNTSSNLGDQINFRASSWMYRNNGTNDMPVFEYVQNDFMQNKMIDLGENASPLFIDLDSDGDYDLLSGSGGYQHDDGYYSTIFYFENTGNSKNAAFELRDEDYFNISSLKLMNLQIQLTDIDMDGSTDFIFSGSHQNQKQTKSIYYFVNQNTSGYNFKSEQVIALNISLSATDNPYFYDLDKDNDADLFIGKNTGRVEYFINQGSNTFELSNEKFFNIDNDIFKRSSSINIADLNGDLKEELIVTDATGVINIYEAFSDHIDEPQPPSQNNFKKNQEQELLAFRLGNKSLISAADLNNDGLAEIIVGTTQGGWQLLKNTSISKETGGDILTFKVYPNPVVQDEQLKIESSENVNLSIYSILGQKINENIEIESRISTIETRTLPNGVYILKIVSGDHEEITKKILIQR